VMTSMMKDVINRGTAAKVRARGFKAIAAGKTGTSRDGWFAGYTPNLVCAVWVGFDDGSQLGMTGGESALPIWADFMTAALAAHPDWGGDWETPATIQQADIDPRTGALAAADSPAKRTEFFINNSAPSEASNAPLDDLMIEGELPEDGGYGTDTAPPLPPVGEPELMPLPEASPRGRTPPRLEGRGITQPDGSSRLSGTITLDVDPTTGLVAADTCPVIRTKTFVIGQQPTERCGPEYHTGKVVPPSGTTRPRLVIP